jgi:hypothetical protein
MYLNWKNILLPVWLISRVIKMHIHKHKHDQARSSTRV